MLSLDRHYGGVHNIWPNGKNTAMKRSGVCVLFAVAAAPARAADNRCIDAPVFNQGRVMEVNNQAIVVAIHGPYIRMLIKRYHRGADASLWKKRKTLIYFVSE